VRARANSTKNPFVDMQSTGMRGRPLRSRGSLSEGQDIFSEVRDLCATKSQLWHVRMWFEQKCREPVRIECWRCCNRGKRWRLIYCRTFLFAFHNMAAGAPAFCNVFTLMRISRKRCSWRYDEDEGEAPKEEQCPKKSIKYLHLRVFLYDRQQGPQTSKRSGIPTTAERSHYFNALYNSTTT